jgi:predicted DCC family thiol-disulfide oxidoreductase YuxK
VTADEGPAVESWTLVYDGDCGFCRYCVDYAKAVTDVEANGSVRYEPFQRVAADYPDISVDEFRNSIQLITPTARHRGADAAFRVLARAPRLRGWAWSYRYVPLFAWIAETAYRFVARHRAAVFRAARPLFGAQLRPADYARTTDWIIRGIGLSALVAFGSWWWQADGLIGSHGILPVADYFDAARAQLGPSGWLQLPSLYWLSGADWMTTTLCAVGVVASLMVVLRVVTTIAALAAYVCYLSLEYGGGVFLEYQWDILLIETLLLAAILSRQPRIGIWLTRLLVFRFMFLSGVVKLISGDPTWHGLTALDYHFETQPLPTVLAWYFNALPHSVLHAFTATALSIELVLPFFVFGPRNVRRLAALGFIGLEVLILLTGNYNFFNFLTIVLCLGLFDDRMLRARAVAPTRAAAAMPWRVLLAAMATLGALQIHQTLGRGTFAAWETTILRAADPLQAVNSYGLFAIMTTERDELIVEGSTDGFEWKTLPFKFKPEALDAAPRWVAPYQPRLDWQMWFAALTSREGAPWVGNLIVRLLNGEPAVLRLLGPSPFADKPPRFIRILRYRYRFTTPEQRERTGAWWGRQYIGVWFPAVRVAAQSSHDGVHIDEEFLFPRSDGDSP